MTGPLRTDPARHRAAGAAWTVAAVGVEVALYASYRGHDARFHWFTHFVVGAGFALVVMAAAIARARRPARRPLVWMVAGHLYAMGPDLVFSAGFAHRRWMDLFLGHISSHFVPGGNVAWFVVFLLCAAGYLAAIDRPRPLPDAGPADDDPPVE